MSTILADTSALVALLDRRERFHPWADQETCDLQPPLVTCEAVVAELCFLLANSPKVRAGIRANLASGAWRIAFSLDQERERVFALMDIYSDQPMSLADACLVRMAELHPDSCVFTLDKHFRIYRRNRRQVIPLIIPSEA